uniref:Hyaluronidase n=1 Tax=Parastrongyloides trichosuri TaxID=131310 RepID=A0A0N4ZNC0_PARTI
MLSLKIITFLSTYIIILTLLTKLTYQDIVPSFYWNSFTEPCIKHGVLIPLEEYGIIANTNQSFQGDHIVIFYERDVGLYPYLKYINSTHNQFFNGGIPQNTDMIAHLKKLRDDIDKIIPNPEFDGLAIIDVEEWRPTYDTNWSAKRIYREESVQHVYTRFPYLSRHEAIELAKKEFDDSAYEFLLKTLKECQTRRPKAKWGFYGFPICDENGLNRNSTFCYREHDDKLINLLKYADALYPSAYLHFGRSLETNKLFIKDVLDESKRMASIIKDLDFGEKLIYVYHKFELNPYSKPDDIVFYSEELLDISIKQTIDSGVDGVILWTTSNNMLYRCSYIKSYVENTLGPYIKNIIYKNLF